MVLVVRARSASLTAERGPNQASISLASGYACIQCPCALQGRQAPLRSFLPPAGYPATTWWVMRKRASLSATMPIAKTVPDNEKATHLGRRVLWTGNWMLDKQATRHGAIDESALPNHSAGPLGCLSPAVAVRGRRAPERGVLYLPCTAYLGKETAAVAAIYAA